MTEEAEPAEGPASARLAICPADDGSIETNSKIIEKVLVLVLDGIMVVTNVNSAGLFSVENLLKSLKWI